MGSGMPPSWKRGKYWKNIWITERITLNLHPFRRHWNAECTHPAHMVTEGVRRWFPTLATVKIHTHSLLSVWSKMSWGSKGIWQTTHGGNFSLKSCLSFIPAEIQTPLLWLKHYSVSQKEGPKYHGEHKSEEKKLWYEIFVSTSLPCKKLHYPPTTRSLFSFPNVDISLKIQPSVNVNTYVVFYVVPT